MRQTLCAILLIAVSRTLAGPPALTVYNQNFAVVRDTVPLDLKIGVNQVRFPETTSLLEPDSVILRDPSGKTQLQILEQNYRGDPVSQESLLAFFEGKTIDFLVSEPTKPSTTVSGKIIRSGYGGPVPPALRGTLAAPQTTPIVEVDGKLRFSLPGLPLFPPLGDDAVLKPTIEWQLQADKAGRLDAELAYVTGGMNWEADYNVIAPEKSDLIDLVGWVTINNQSGKTFENAKIKLMAGDVSKIQPNEPRAFMARDEMAMKVAAAPAVTEKSFEDFHLYSLARPATLRDRETKQVEFVRASGVKAERAYVYDGLKMEVFRGYPMQNMRNNQELGVESDTKVAIMREFKNSEANHLGMALPKGRLRFYKQDDDGQLEFTGENLIDHTAKDETIRVYTGNAFDLAGERTRTDVKVDSSNHWLDESFTIKLRNHKKEPVEIRVVEHLFRWTNWEITEKSDAFSKTNAQAIEFRVPLKPDEEKVVNYKVHYSW